ncbi:MAG: IPT/TIG domain-containing protein, partial [Blastocatellia bacterium]
NNETPAISGDGTKVVFVSNAALGGTTNADYNYEVYLADLPRNATTATIKRITDTGKDFETEFVKEIFSNYSPTINDDGSVLAFVSTRKAFKAVDGGAAAFSAAKEGATSTLDPDGNGEIFLYRTAAKSFAQVTVTRDADATTNFVVKGFNANPYLSGNGQRLVFLSGFNYPGANANKNTDFNGEIFTYKAGDPVNTFTQVTETTGSPAVPNNNVVNVLVAFTHPLSSDGTKLVFESAGDFAGKNTEKLREIFLADLSGAKPTFTQITDQTTVDATKNDFNYFPSINSTGKFITFTSVLNLTPATTSGISTDNADSSREVFRYDIANSKFREITFTGPSLFVLDQRANSNSSFLDDAGSAVTFTYDQNLIGTNGLAIQDVFQAYVRPVTSANSTAPAAANAASFDATQVARGSIVALFGTQLANATISAPSANLPFLLGGVTVTVNGLAARLIFVSAGQINFVVPDIIANGDTVEIRVNNNGVQSTGKAKIVTAAPGVFTITGDGKGKAAAQCGQVSPDGLSFLVTNPPCAVGNDAQFNVLTLYGTGWRNTAGLQVKIGDLTFTPSYAGPQPEFPGLDQINVTLSKDLAAKIDQDITVSVIATTNIDSNKSTTSFIGFQEALTVSNAASFEGGTVARGSVAFIQGTNLANDTATPTDFPLELKGVKVTVAGVAARLVYISPTQINFIVPNETKPATLVEVVVNNNGTISRGRMKVFDVSPGLFTTTSDGNGRALVKCGKVNADGSITLSDPPCSVGTAASPNIIRVFGTGWRNADKVVLKIGDVELTNTYAGGQPAGNGAFTPGIDIIDAKLDATLAGKTDVDVVVTITVNGVSTSSKAGIKVSFTSN